MITDYVDDVDGGNGHIEELIRANVKSEQYTTSASVVANWEL